ncbi:lysylphosphatidylglycerol synthase domain-containing protein [Sporichthya polymorpha]|uniref:lysylphosphatidylglycerol synthase domain-containing protein n=1 Tax=Sporichthya polymorpha TaxID=35751 RepID=UPI00036C4755|nr:lysylphosphatidylglycerol synthase domain-containing protein [Sporichthya polymorpha]
MRKARTVIGIVVLALSVVYLVQVVDGPVLRETAEALAASPGPLALALLCYAAAFALRSWAWTRTLPGLEFSQSWAALHVSVLGNHVLPFRLGEILRVTSVLRRTSLAVGPVTATTVTLRLADLLSVAVLALVAVPGLAGELIGAWAWILAVALAAAAVPVLVWARRLLARGPGERVRLPAATIVGTAFVAWALEATLAWQVAHAAGVSLDYHEAIAVTAVAIAAQTVALTPGGIGSYEAAGTAALAALGVDAGTAFAIALATHAVKTAYSLVVGGVALVTPAPGYWGNLRLPRVTPPRPEPYPVAPDAPVVAVIPVYNEQDVVAEVVRRLPATVEGRPLVCIVVDDGSADASAARAADAGAVVVPHEVNRGLGAAVRTALREASALSPAAVVYLDADGEYAPEDLPTVAAPVLAGTADYVVGSRFAGNIEHMRPHRRLGNLVLTRWVRWTARRRDLTDGQSGYRAFSARAAAEAEIIHDYNYAQVLTLDLLGKGFGYAEVPIRYHFRTTGDSFVKLGRYLRKVVPAVHRELNADRLADRPPLPTARWRTRSMTPTR